MEKILYLVRHCQAAGQEPDAPLTKLGVEQAEKLSKFFDGVEVDHVISSPFLRAVQTIEPLAEKLGIPLETDGRLAERLLSPHNLPDWMERLKASFLDLDLKLEGGESGREAAERGMAVLQEASNHSVLVTHGNMLGLLLNQLNRNFGFEEWQKLSNPDVYKVIIEDEKGSSTRLWN